MQSVEFIKMKPRRHGVKRGPQAWQTRKPESIQRRRQIINAAGGRCFCCNERNFEFLTLEHVGGGGTAEAGKTSNGNSRTTSIKLLKRAARHGIDGTRYSILCYNCNGARGNWGYCPHAEERRRNRWDAERLAGRGLGPIPTSSYLPDDARPGPMMAVPSDHRDGGVHRPGAVTRKPDAGDL